MRVLNKRTDELPTDAIYIGRPSEWGNPFRIGQDGTREQVVAAYERWARATFTDSELLELDGYDLVCWCAPKACHGDVLVKLVGEAIERERRTG